MQKLPTAAGMVAYQETGDGPPIVLLHATLHDHHDFDAIAGPLAANYRVIAVDWPGHGESDPNPTITAPALADVLAEIVETLHLGPAVFIGNSIGGFAAARLALDHPDRVAGLILVQSGGFVRRSIISRVYCRAFGSSLVARRLLPHIVPYYMKPMTANDDAVVTQAVRAAKTPTGRAMYSSLWHSFTEPAFDLTGSAAAITAPTQIVWGKRDPIIPLRFGNVAHRLIPGSQLEVFNTGHAPFSSQPDEFLQFVEPFVRSVHAAVA
ncbi:alpha/beta hydrolase [Mycobacterium sp. OTB74]|uniref:alpha/beta fold hydrolase n=1 Tax=Mycobacterium sp. OTB74 TaxID=1853452 RepID=UPI0024767128|nr:alpha/beta hydrolase [Mycobacterium sp. OTB74]MDH6243258.1 pimeloyl-ACP methyl ester carboxylesterase [Mycobacterium sp. OTB74]